ncbi:MAG: hypothetical protein M3536_10155, partial [Actinomycetota bacterium]|nr:hypothetical protein [Actinomycetota bacterium]
LFTGGVLPIPTFVARMDQGAVIECWDGAGWRRASPTFAEYANSAVLNSVVPANGQLGPFLQTFPAGRFTQAPIITFGVSNARLSAAFSNVTTTGFDLYIRNDTSVDTASPATISFTAKQMTSSSAAG